ncbi:hypothetical protein BpHYR1_014597 [Brachionus plicatilis]|uniref:Uncharacterized protein n=1 Tax=Brachionus plicatilis TaxID=10195 RepID=A0A3M7PW73_BRAPC|nr:hypothetical protein BpHYR1_014597 [Brachionus plicatilis]
MRGSRNGLCENSCNRATGSYLHWIFKLINLVLNENFSKKSLPKIDLNRMLAKLYKFKKPRDSIQYCVAENFLAKKLINVRLKGRTIFRSNLPGYNCIIN